MLDKEFRINHIPGQPQYVTVTEALGRILMRDEVDEIVGSYGSTAKKDIGGRAIDIIPPLPKNKLPALGRALVRLAIELDPSDPKPTFKIT